jgi:exodeoxyribonuclease VII small subunit
LKSPMKQSKSTQKDSAPSFEQSLKRLEEIVESLEGGSVPLEDALNLYEEGVKISKECLEKLSKAEVRLKHLMKDVDGKISLSDEIEEE